MKREDALELKIIDTLITENGIDYTICKLSQNTEILILDEPTNHLDIKYQIQIMELVKETRKTILAVIHDINIASSYCSYIYALKDGKICFEGSPEEIFTKEKIKNIFDVEADVLIHPKNKKPLIVF